MSHFRTAAGTLAAIVATLALASCAPVVEVAPSVSPTPPPAASGDGVLRIGTLFPTSGPIAYLSPAQVAGVELAVREINEAGGVLGAPVEVFHRNSGEAATETVEASFAELVAKGVDVVIGPSSSGLAERILPLVVAEQVLLISPSASSPQLSSLDDAGLLSRTVPSTALQGRALAQLILQDTADAVAVIAFDDERGAAIAESLVADVETGGGTIVASETFAAGTLDFGAIVAAVREAAPDAVALAGSMSTLEQNTALLAALNDAGLAGPKLWVTSGSLADYSLALPAGTMTGVRGLLEGAAPDEAFIARVRSMNPAVTDFRFAAEAYDATILAAIAAHVAQDDGAPLVAFTLAGVSGSGIKCLSLGECLDVLRTQDDIDYDGVSGPIALDGRGDPGIAHYGVYSYDGANRFSRTGDVLIE